MHSFFILLVLLSLTACSYGFKTAMDNILAVNTKIIEQNEKAGYSVNSDVIFEGDIDFNAQTAQQIQNEYKKAIGTANGYDAISGQWYKWPNAVVPYVIDNSLRNVPRAMQAINSAIATYSRLTCIRLIPRTNQRDYVWMNLNPKKGCSSWIGKQGGGQELSLNWGCHSTGTAIHEIMHAIGFFHEQSRLDRDSYVNIYWNNIAWNQKFNFRMYRRGEATTYGHPYDKQSIMHYSRYSFPLNRRYPTITSKSNYNERLGGNQLTSTDIAQINTHYSCKGTGGKVLTKPPSNCWNTSSDQKCLEQKNWGFCSRQFVRQRCRKTCGLC